MSAPPPSSPPTVNPDRRQLPDGWITRWDGNYHAWYYVDTRAQPPRSSWAHPLGAAPSSPQPSTAYAPPSNPPPNRAYNSGGPSFPGQYVGPQQYSQTSPYPSGPGYQVGQPDQRNFQGLSPQPQGGYPQGYGYPAQQGWQGGWQQAQQPVYPQPQQQSSRGSGRGGGGIGMGGLALAAGGGLLGGALLENAFEDHDRDEYNEGFQDGQDGDYDGGDF
ncbi:hypothetical protein EDB84DRAFT_1537763 [Lactarius hengduanensis]|nr:hypothetical protein EDB84DRAFT_1537763 [Lactarius hengduanensis]